MPHSPRLPCSEELGRGGLNHNRPPLYRLHPTRCLRSGTTACPWNMPELWSMESSLDQGLLHPAAPLGTFLLHNQLQRQSPGGSHGDQAQTLISLSINNADKRHTPPSDPRTHAHKAAINQSPSCLAPGSVSCKGPSEIAQDNFRSAGINPHRSAVVSFPVTTEQTCGSLL